MATLQTATGITIQLSTIAPAVVADELGTGAGVGVGSGQTKEAVVVDSSDEKVEQWLPREEEIFNDSETFLDCMFVLFRLRKVMQDMDEDEATQYLAAKYGDFARKQEETDIGEFMEIAELTTAIDLDVGIHDSVEQYSFADLEQFGMRHTPLNELVLYDTLLQLSRAGTGKSAGFGLGLGFGAALSAAAAAGLRPGVEGTGDGHGAVTKKERVLAELKDISSYVCQGCAQLIDLSDAKEVELNSRFWQGFRCAKTGREMIFHNKLCVKLRKIKEIIREKEYELAKSKGKFGKWMNINADTVSQMGAETRPKMAYTTFDECFEEQLSQSFMKNVREYREQSQRFALNAIADVVGTDRFEHVPDTLRFLDFREFGQPVFLWLLDRVAISKFEAFWPLAKYFGMQIPTPLMIDMLHNAKYTQLLMRDRDDMGEFITFATMVCEAAIYPMATALWFAAFIRRDGGKYWRPEQLDVACDFFVKLAQRMIGEIESPQLMAITLEIPTNVEGLSAMELALRNHMLTFLQDPRITDFATTLWHERKPIHPGHDFGLDLSLTDQWLRLAYQPAKFYTTPSGFAVIKSALYLAFVVLFNYVTWAKRYNYDKVRDAEYVLWFFAFGQLMFVVYSLFTNFGVYLKQAGSTFELTMAFFWMLLGAMRFHVILKPERIGCAEDLPAWACEKHGVDGPATRAQFRVQLYMFLWALQCIMFWVKFMFFWRRLRKVGPMIRMIILMVREMVIFMGVMTLVFVGVALALYYIIATDLEHTEYELGTGGQIMEYTLRVILGQHEWDAVQSNDDFSSLRSFMAQGWVLFSSVVGTIIMLNLLVAILANSYSEVRQTAGLEVNFLRVEESYNASQSGVLIPPPLNYLAFLLMGLWLLLDFVVGLLTKGTKMVDDWYFSPLNKKVLRPGDWVTFNTVQMNAERQQFEETTVSGYIYRLKCAEVGIIQDVNSEGIEVLERDIVNIRKEFITEKNSEQGNIWKSVSRYYCKYCRYEFMTPDVGSAAQISELFKRHGKQLDPDDLGKLSNQLGEHLDVNVNAEKRTNEVAQLCPQCYRPFYASPARADELGRFMFLAEAASFWVFAVLMWIPLVIVLAIPAFCSWLGARVAAMANSDSKEASDGSAARGRFERERRLMRETRDVCRYMVRRVLAEELRMDEVISVLKRRVENVREKVQESVLEYEVNSIPYRCQRRVAKNQSWLDPKRRKQRAAKLKEALRELRQGLNTLKTMIRQLLESAELELLDDPRLANELQQLESVDALDAAVGHNVEAELEFL